MKESIMRYRSTRIYFHHHQMEGIFRFSRICQIKDKRRRGVEISEAFKLLILYPANTGEAKRGKGEGRKITQPFLFYLEDTHSLELRLIILLFYLQKFKNLSLSKKPAKAYLPSLFNVFPFLSPPFALLVLCLESHLHDSVNVFIDILNFIFIR